MIEDLNEPDDLRRDTLSDEESKDSGRNKFLDLLKENKLSSFLALALVTVIVWFAIKQGVMEREFRNEKNLIIKQHQSKIDSLQIDQMKFATEVFSWSVRSELLRNNVENLNQLVSIFIKNSDADVIQLVNPENHLVLISSDKKFEDKKYVGNLDFEIDKTLVIEDKGIVKIITPVMGFNSMLGILITEVRKEGN